MQNQIDQNTQNLNHGRPIVSQRLLEIYFEV